MIPVKGTGGFMEKPAERGNWETNANREIKTHSGNRHKIKGHRLRSKNFVPSKRKRDDVSNLERG